MLYVVQIFTSYMYDLPQLFQKRYKGELAFYLFFFIHKLGEEKVFQIVLLQKKKKKKKKKQETVARRRVIGNQQVLRTRENPLIILTSIFFQL